MNNAKNCSRISWSQRWLMGIFDNIETRIRTWIRQHLFMFIFHWYKMKTCPCRIRLIFDIWQRWKHVFLRRVTHSRSLCLYFIFSSSLRLFLTSRLGFFSSSSSCFFLPCVHLSFLIVIFFRFVQIGKNFISSNRYKKGQSYIRFVWRCCLRRWCRHILFLNLEEWMNELRIFAFLFAFEINVN